VKRLEDLAERIRNSIKLKTIRKGYFSEEENVMTGLDLINWFKTELKITNCEEIEKIAFDMNEQGILHSLNAEEKEFQNTIYRFQVDEPEKAANMLQIYKGPAKDPIHLTADLVGKVNELLKEVRVELSSSEVGIKTEKLKKSKVYHELKKQICELQTISFKNLSNNEKTACFLNIYQVKLRFYLKD